MLEVMNAGPTDLPGNGVDSAVILNCWEKSSTPLIQELERTVNFAERKCGDLMQQLNYYKEYYEKWIHAERMNNSMYPKKKFKKYCKFNCDAGSSSENELERVNQYFYKKIRNKITEMNQEITQANRKINNKFTYSNITEKPDAKGEQAFMEYTSIHCNPEFKPITNKICKSEPLMTTMQKDIFPSSTAVYQECQDDIKLTEKQSTKSVPVIDSKKMNFTPQKKRFSSLQRYKLRSKSLPQGVRRKFGFGGFVEVIDPKKNMRSNIRSKSRTSLKADSFRSFKTFKSDTYAKQKLTETKSGYLCKLRRNPSISSRSLQCRVPKPKTAESSRECNKTTSSKDEKSKSLVLKKLPTQSKFDNALGSICSKPPSATLCQELAASNEGEKSSIVNSNVNTNVGNLNSILSKPSTLIPFLKQPIPFIPCSSTTKTFNLGLNVQQVLSMIKHRRHSITLQTVIKNGMKATRSITDKIEPTVNTLFFSHTTTSHSQVTSTLCPARNCIEDTVSVVTDNIGCRSNCALLKQAQAMRSESMVDNKLQNLGNHLKFSDGNKLERPEDVWVVEQPDPKAREYKKLHSKCTCFPSKHCVDYQKVLRQYTGWRGPTSKTASFTSEDYTSYQSVITYPKTKLCSIPSQENVNWTMQESDGKIELIKVQNDLINLNRKFSSLEEQINQKHMDEYEANAEMNAMESELSVREMEFKDIMSSYKQLITLKEKLKALRVKNINSTSQTAIQLSHSQRPKKDPLRPTPSMALTKILRKIQGLQDKIKLIDEP